MYDDQLKDATLTTSTGETAIDFARITDGLRAEREQGITIDVAYRYFPHHGEKVYHCRYTRTRSIYTKHGDRCQYGLRSTHPYRCETRVLTQSRRHVYIASLLGIPHLLVCVNKMDLADLAESRLKRSKKIFYPLLQTCDSKEYIFSR